MFAVIIKWLPLQAHLYKLHTSHATLINCLSIYVLDSSARVCLPLAIGYCKTSNVSVLRQNILFWGLFLRKNLIITVPWSRAWRICGISAPSPSAIRAMATALGRRKLEDYA